MNFFIIMPLGYLFLLALLDEVLVTDKHNSEVLDFLIVSLAHTLLTFNSLKLLNIIARNITNYKHYLVPYLHFTF